MKKALFLLLITFSTLSAQKGNYKNEFNIGISGVTVPQIIDFAQDFAQLAALFASENSETTVPFYLEYSRFVSDRIRISGNFNYYKIEKDVRFMLTDDIVGKYKEKYYTGIIGLNYHYGKSGFSTFYSGIYVGALYRDSDDNVEESLSKDKTFFAYHINLIGLKLGKKFTVSCELGFGFKGIINAGIGYRF